MIENTALFIIFLTNPFKCIGKVFIILKCDMNKQKNNDKTKNKLKWSLKLAMRGASDLSDLPTASG